jgi:hypothetical protein
MIELTRNGKPVPKKTTINLARGGMIQERRAKVLYEFRERIVLYRVWCLTLVSFREDHCKKTLPPLTWPFFVLPSQTNHEQKTMHKSEKQGVVYKFNNTAQANSCPNVNKVQRF